MTPLDLAIWRLIVAADSGGGSLINPSTVVAGIAAVAALGGAYLTYRSSTRANAASDKKVDLEEHRDAIARLQAIINEQDKHQDRLRTQLDRVNNQIDSMRTQVAREQDVSQLLRSQVQTLQDQVRTFQRMLDERAPHRAAAAELTRGYDITD